MSVDPWASSASSVPLQLAYRAALASRRRSPALTLRHRTEQNTRRRPRPDHRGNGTRNTPHRSTDILINSLIRKSDPNYT
ncbi:MAG: hypothetical protein H0V92_09420 [Pseudonocardiales bacterium]|nr:hypothetical protein [Pseudonocardiales bacterium]